MCALRRPVIVLFVLGTCLPGTVALSAVREGATEARVEAAQYRLRESHWKLASGVLKVDEELKKVSQSNSEADLILKSYRLRFNKLLARAGTMGRGERPVLSTRDPKAIADYLERVDRIYLATLRLSSNFESNGMTRVRELEGAAPPASRVPAGTSSCYGSIAGTVQTPSGPLDGILVAAYTAEGDTAGSALTSGNGSYQIDNLLAGQEYYLVTSNADALIDEVFDDVVCPGGSCDPTIGSPITVSAGKITSGYDFSLAAGGRIGGVLTTQSGLVALPLTTVNIFDAAGEIVTSAISELDGTYLTEAGLPAGTYHVVTAGLFFGNLDELYDNIPCPSGGSCDPTSGTAVMVTVPNITSGIDFDLAAGGNITGNITDSSTTLPIGNILVGIHDDSGQLIAFGASDVTGNYSILSGLPTGNFFAATGNFEGYVDELYDDIPCTGGLCTITGGSSISVTLGAVTSGVDFALSPGGTFSGQVTRADDGTPLADVFVLGHTDAGDLVGTATTDVNGDYTLMNGLGTGSYRATTLNPLGLDDQLYDGLACPSGVCDVTVGSAIAVTQGLDTLGIDFSLTGDAISSCSFEGCSVCGYSMYP